MSEDWCIEQIAKLQIKERRLDTLNEIRTQLGNMGPNEVSISAKFLSLLDSIDDCRDRYILYLLNIASYFAFTQILFVNCSFFLF